MFVEGGSSPVRSTKGRREELAEAPTDWLEREIGDLAAQIAAATCRWLELVAEFDRRGAHEAWGFHSCGAWIAWRCALDPRSAREHVRVARALEGLEAVRECFGRGELSYSKVRAITRITTPENESELLEMARWATAAQLERLVRGYRRAVSLESAEAAHRDRFLACEWDENGSLLIRGRLAPEDGALLLKAMEAGKEAICERETADRVCAQGVARKADGSLVFRRPDGRVVPAVPSPACGSASELRERNRAAGGEVLPGALRSLGRGERYDRELAVAGLLARAGP